MLRWRIAILVSAAIAISYLDRQTLPVAVHAIAKDIPLSNQQFSALQSAFLLSYALMYAGGGKLADALGTRRGFAVIMTFWSLANASHALAAGFGMLMASRFLLGMGEGGGFPTATRAVAEWFPAKERASAMGIINAGTAVGAVIAPPLIAIMLDLFQLALDFCGYRRPGADLGVVVDQVIFFAGGSSRAEPGGTQPVCFRSFRFHAEDALERSASDSRVVGVGECQIPERCGLVFLSFLASEISLRRARIRREGRRNLSPGFRTPRPELAAFWAAGFQAIS